MYIYIGTNTISSKQYVGQSIRDPHKRRIRERITPNSMHQRTTEHLLAHKMNGNLKNGAQD